MNNGLKTKEKKSFIEIVDFLIQYIHKEPIELFNFLHYISITNSNLRKQ